tara:strand:+ start:495 stop:647 length:153 start_codon:yes stop_codon:yes gene_type:complete
MENLEKDFFNILNDFNMITDRLIDLKKMYPNDQELGSAVRQFIKTLEIES